MLDKEIDPMTLPILNNAIPGTLPPLKKKNNIFWWIWWGAWLIAVVYLLL